MSPKKSLLYAFLHLSLASLAAPGWRTLIRLSAVLVLIYTVTGCVEGQYASIPTGTQITPNYFQFAEIVPEEERGGWRAVCIRALVGKRTMHSPHGPVTGQGIVCAIEVGVPISNTDRGYIPLSVAQKISADIANATAYRVLQASPTATMAEICQRITTEMHQALRVPIKGATVTKCGVTKWKKPVPVVDWPGTP